MESSLTHAPTPLTLPVPDMYKNSRCSLSTSNFNIVILQVFVYLMIGNGIMILISIILVHGETAPFL